MGTMTEEPAATIHIETTDRRMAAAAKGIRVNEAQAGMNELEALCHHKIAAAEAFSEACRRVAAKANMFPGVLSAYITARCRDKLDENREKAEQLSLLFGEEI